MLPYEPKATAVFAEDFLCRLYAQLKEEGTLDIIFAGMNFSHLNEFVAYMSRARGLVICCLHGEGFPVPRPVGFGWLPEVNGVDGARTGTFGFGFFKEMWSKRERVGYHRDLSMLMLRYWFEQFKIDRLFATTLNPMALNYSKRFGFEYHCRLPQFFIVRGVLEDAHLISLERERFLRYYSDWYAGTPNPRE